MNPPRIAKAERLRGRNLSFRNAVAADAAFVLALRTDARIAAHLSRVSPLLADQVAWLERYRLAQDQAYFIIERHDGEPLGTVRLYDAQGDSFCWGSWILKSGAPNTAAIESAMMVYSYALDTLGFSAAHFQVRRDNVRVCEFHERFGAVRAAVDNEQIEYLLSNGAIRASMQRYARFLPAHATTEVLT